MKLKLLILLVVVIIQDLAFGQTFPNSLRIKEIQVKSDTIQIDTLSIVPESFEIRDQYGKLLEKISYSIDYAKSELILIQMPDESLVTIIRVKYRVLPINLSKSYSRRDTSLIIGNYQGRKKKLIDEEKTESGFIEDDKLDKSGSISRGFAIGNQRDLMSMSNLNLQLSGKLNDEVSILAAISDNSMPIQPEGNTQQIQEFDKIFIQLYTKKSGIKLGDIEMEKPEGYFLNLKKQTRGIQMYSDFSLGKEKNFVLKSELSAGLAKGKYTRLKIQGLEGNQGPYRLFGANNETYIMVLSGSEKVYIDGKMLTRGDKFDYIIDYNSAEIIFTSNQPITKDSRITVEFEYAQQIYPRIHALQTNYLQGKKSAFWLNLYTEKDNKNDPLSDNYNDSTKTFLASIGDSIYQAIAPGYRKSEFSADKVLYELIDTIAAGQYFDSIFRYSSDPAKAEYQITFSYVGQNKGNYVREVSAANGKVYKWIAPFRGFKQGSYEPVTFYTTPKKNSLVSMGGKIKTGSFGTGGFEVAFSNFDVNTYSSQDNDDDRGYAIKLNLEQGLYNKDTNNVQLKFFANYQMADKKFKPIENFYEVEFEREWNLPAQINSWQEQRFTAGISFLKKNFGFINLSTDYMLRENSYSGKKALFNALLRVRGFEFESKASYLKSSDIWKDAGFLKYKNILSKHLKLITIGLSEETEQNTQYLLQTDSLQYTSFKFSEYSVFFSEPDSSINQYFASYKFRKEYIPLSNELQNNANSQTVQAGLNMLKNKYLKWKTVLTYRKLEYKDSINPEKNKVEETFSGRQELNLQLSKGAVNFGFFYETASGLEIKKEYIYVEVQKGQGQFTWIDYNTNGIKELDEFEIAKFADMGNYIRLFIPGNESERVYTTQLNQSILFQPERIWSKNKGIKGVIALFSDQFAYRIMQKSNHQDLIPDITDNIYIRSQFLIVRNNFSFKSKNKKWQIDYLYEKTDNKSLLLNGSDKRIVKDNSLRLKWKIFNILTFFNSYKKGNQSLESEYFSTKNYSILSGTEELSLQLQPAESFYSTLSYRNSSKQNQTGFEKSVLNEIKLLLNQVFSSKINIQADVSFVQTRINSESNTSISYEMLEGLQTGRNLIWSISYNHKLSKLFQLSIGYNGRSSENSQVIHNGNVQVMANF